MVAVVGRQADEVPHVYVSFLFNSAEHSYGSSMVSSKDGDESESSFLQIPFCDLSHHNNTTREV